ncbi:MAG: PepSY-like domain-containing protein [Bacteroidota bacterium]
MKKIISGAFVFIMVIGNNDVTAQIRKIPAAVTQSFKVKFPEVAEVEWKDKLTVFEASYEVDAIKYQSTFNNKGEWKKTETEIAEEDLPSEVQEGLDKSKYKSWEIKTVSNVQTIEGQKFMLVVQKSALQKKRLYFSYDGQLIKDPITF